MKTSILLTAALVFVGSFTLVAQIDSTKDAWEDSGNNMITPTSFTGNVGVKVVGPPLKDFEVNGDVAVRKDMEIGTTNTWVFHTQHWTGSAGAFHIVPSVNGVIDWSRDVGFHNSGCYTMTVEGKLGAREIEVETGSWCDYVFEPDYPLMPLKELDTYLKEEKHLPGIPTEEEVIENGVNLGEMDKLLLKKVEELTLYIIMLEKKLQELEAKQ